MMLIDGATRDVAMLLGVLLLVGYRLAGTTLCGYLSQKEP